MSWILSFNKLCFCQAQGPGQSPDRSIQGQYLKSKSYISLILQTFAHEAHSVGEMSGCNKWKWKQPQTEIEVKVEEKIWWSGQILGTPLSLIKS